VWLMDEPLSNLDALLRVQMRAELKRLQKELKITTIYVTHDQTEAMTMGDRVAVMNAGKVLCVGTPHEVYHKPTTKFVASFIGSPPMNFIEVTFSVRGGDYVLQSETFELRLPKELGEVVKTKVSEGAELDLGIRPEDIIISTSEDKEAIPATVYVVEPLGSKTIINIKLNNDIIKAKVPGELLLETGSKIWIRFNLDKIHLFDKKTEKAVI